MFKKMYPLTLLALLWSVGVYADPWTGKGELGFVQVSGNTESETLNAGFQMEKKQESWEHKAKAAAVRATSNDVDSAESYLASWRSRYNFSERSYAFGDLRYFDDKFDSFEEIYTAAVGVGRTVIMSDAINWDLSAGVGYQQRTVEITKEDESGITYLLESEYDHKLTETADFENDTRVEISQDNTFSQNIASLSVSINSSLALKASYEVRHNSDPEPGFKSVDRILSINVVYKF